MADEFGADPVAAEFDVTSVPSDESQELAAVREQATRALALLEAGDPDQARAELASLLAVPPPVPVPEPADLPLQGLDGVASADFDRPASDDSLLSGDFDQVVGDDELDMAFESAESDPSEMHDANRVAERALDQADPDPFLAEAAATDAGPDPAPILEDAFRAGEHSAFATETMAGLLEGQGHTAPAQAIRESLYVEPCAADETVESSSWEGDDENAAPEPGVFVGAESTEDGVPGVAATSHDPGLASRLRTLVTLESWLENVRRNVA